MKMVGTGCRAIFFQLGSCTLRQRRLLLFSYSSSATPTISSSRDKLTTSAYRTTKYPPTSAPPPPQNPNSVPAGPSPPSRPTEIPFQPKAANSVNFIGYIGSPIHSQTSPEGKFRASTSLTLHKDQDHTSLWIPVIFEGDLAHIAACHLKENDYVYVGGHLTAFASPRVHKDNTKFQVLVRHLNFVQKSYQLKHASGPSKLEEKKTHSENMEDNIYVDKSWMDLIVNPQEWWLITLKKGTSGGAAFERKSNGEVLQVNDLTPVWIREKLESIAFDPKPASTSVTDGMTKRVASEPDQWRQLIDNPKQWWDYRSNKLSGLAKAKHPDFKHKDTGIPLWLNQAPGWVSSKLGELEFDVPVCNSAQLKAQKDDESWKDLLENPEKWWDNRLNKTKDRAPDFRNKETGVALWLGSSPAWVLSKLPPPNTFGKGNQRTARVVEENASVAGKDLVAE